MKTARFLLTLTLATVSVLPAIAQSRVVEIQVTEEYRPAGAQTPEAARQRAAALAGRKVFRDAAVRLQEFPEVKAVPLKANQIDAFLPVIATLEEGPSSPGSIQVLLRLRPDDIAQRLDQLRKDTNAATGLMEVWKQNESVLDQLTQTGPDPKERDLINRLNVTHLVAHVYAALAKTEESPASARVPSEKGRQRAWQLAEMAVATGPGVPDAHLAVGDVLWHPISAHPPRRSIARRFS